MESVADLKEFRKCVYDVLGPSRDSLFDLMDATLTSRALSSFAEVSLSPLFRRQWPSLYKGIERGQPPGRKLMKLCAPLIPEMPQVVLVGDHTAYSRRWSPTLQERTYEHQPQPQPGAKPITLGVGYSTIACIPEEQGSWALPLLHERITSFETPLGKAAEQLQQVCEAIESRPISLWLIWTGKIMPSIATVWRLYLRRFCVDHWYRFIKQRLHWCLPHLGSTAQMDVWSTLMPLMSWQLWLARDQIQDNPLPWQTKSVSRPTPGRVANSFALVLVVIGTPAQFPKLRGKSTGWPTGRKRTPRPRYPTVKKSYSRPKFRSRSRA